MTDSSCSRRSLGSVSSSSSHFGLRIAGPGSGSGTPRRAPRPTVPGLPGRRGRNVQQSVKRAAQGRQDSSLVQHLVGPGVHTSSQHDLLHDLARVAPDRQQHRAGCVHGLGQCSTGPPGQRGPRAAAPRNRPGGDRLRRQNTRVAAPGRSRITSTRAPPGNPAGPGRGTIEPVVGRDPHLPTGRSPARHGSSVHRRKPRRACSPQPTRGRTVIGGGPCRDAPVPRR